MNGYFSPDTTKFPEYTLGKAIRDSVFTVTSLFTSTGFTIVDYDEWTHFAKWLLLMIIVIGGCAGSTCGGIKTIRFVILCKVIFSRMQSVFQPKTVKTIRVGGQVISEEIQKTVIGFILLWMVIGLFSTLILCWLGLPIVTSISAVVANLGNCGPGMEYVGGFEDYTKVPSLGKIILCVLMLIGRVELYSILVLFLPSFWREK